MDQNTLQRLKDAIAKSNSIGVAVGHNPTIDEMGAALSLYLLLRNANKRVSIAGPSDPIVEISSLVAIDRVQRNFGGDAGDLVVSFPYKEGEIEKVSYTLENNFLNIIVKSSEQGLSFDERDVRYSRGSGSIDLLIVVGTASLADIGDVVDSQKLGDIQIINIDNDPNNQGFGDIVLLSQQASSVSEHVADIALSLGFPIDQDSAQNLMSGIMTATSNFQDPRTSALAFEISSYLMKQGAHRVGGSQNNAPRPMGQPQQPASRFDQPAQGFNQPAPAMSQPRPQPQQHDEPMQQPRYNDQAQQSRYDEPMQQPRYDEQVQQPQSVQQPQQAPRTNAMPDNFDQAEQADDQNEKPPLDWLTPKVYKGSSEV